MNPTREETLLALALEKPPGKRAAFLDAVCDGDPALRARLEALLAANDKPEPLPSAGTPAVKATIKLDLADAEDESIGKNVGRYKILEKVGEGGCGVVYVAEQTEPVRRRVALKVIKLGMDTKQVIARFEAERQALAMMDHPNIAKVLDAGATEAGRPFFVMELVRGIRITEYCDQANLTTKERLDLFIKVCQAIQHAHQKGIIHRDIKPSNILVTMHDGVPVPKVIDFGIAKATVGQTLTDKTLYTQLQQFIGTPAYMSPEQAEMSGLDIDTRSDIYGLGVLLYELLAGSTPFDATELMSQGIDAMRKTIREKEPVRPSTRLATLKGEELTTTAKRRSADTSKLLHQLKGDLDWIVMKCLEKDRTRRYETASGLASDLKRHLENEPVVARPPSAIYRFQKAIRRNKLAFGAGLAVILALMAGLSLAAIGWRQTRMERDRALQARAEEEVQRKTARASEQKAQANEEKAESQALAARRTAYNSDMNLVQQALAANNFGRARSLLNRQKPQSGQLDLRGWEWRYLWRQTRADAHEEFFTGTNRLISPMSISADGILIAREYDGHTLVSALKTCSTIWERTNAWRPAFAHHSATLAFLERSSTNDTITLLDISSQQETHLITPWRETISVDFTPDDRRLVTVSRRADAGKSNELVGFLTLWDVDTKRQLWQRPTALDPDFFRQYTISPDGEAFASILQPGIGNNRSGWVQVLEMRDGSERFAIKTTEDIAGTAVVFSPDSSTLLTGAGFTDSNIRLWDAHSGKALGSMEGHRSYVTDLIFTPDGKRLISSSADQTIQLWDWSTRQPAGVLRGHLDEVDGLAVVPDGQTLASRCKDGSIYLWDATKPSRHLGYETFTTHWNGRQIEFTPDSRSILEVQPSGSGVALWDPITLKETLHSWKGSTIDRDFRLSPDAAQMVQRDGDGHLLVWDLRSGLESTKSIADTNEFDSDFSRNGKIFAMGRIDGTNVAVDAWDTDTWQRKGSMIAKSDGARSVWGTAQPNIFVIVNKRGFQFFDLTKLNDIPRQVETRRDAYLISLATSPDGRLAVATFNDGSIGLWDVTTLQLLDNIKGFLLIPHSVTFSPDGRRFAAGGSGREAVKVWDTETRQEVLTLSGEGSVFATIEFSSDGRYLLAVNIAGLAHLWSAPTWDEIAAVEAAEKQGQQP